MQELNKDIFAYVLNLYRDTDAVSINRIEKRTKKIMPENINFNLVSMAKDKYETQGGAMRTLYCNGQTEQYRIELPTENNLLEINNLSILMHEYTHFFDYLLNPKCIKTEEKVLQSGLSESLSSFYKNHYYTNKDFSFTKEIELMKGTKRETKKYLDKLPNEQKIIVLKSLRNLMQSELNAYNQGFEYSTKLLQNNRKYNGSDMIGIERTFMLDKKIEYVKKLLFKVLSKERYINAKTNSANKIDKIKALFTYFKSVLAVNNHTL